MHKKIRVAILFGGKSAEHEVSLESAKNIIASMDKEKYEVVLIGIDKKGRWFLDKTSETLLNIENPKLKVKATSDVMALVPGTKEHQLVSLADYKSVGPVDVVFPVLHGPFGEDGTVQGLLRAANLPFVGAGVIGSAIGMDKDVMKRLLREAAIPTPRFLVFKQSALENIDFEDVKRKVGLPCFIKPANLGSSVGINRVKSKKQFECAVKEAFQYDRKILIEEYIEGREIECSVLGNENPLASVPGEVIAQHEFYSYEAKYIDKKGALLEIPAKLPTPVIKEVQNTAIEAFKALCCEGMARVDFFLRDDHEILVNEINTIPGFTGISMYPKLWEASGISYTEVIDRLIQLAFERFDREKKLKISKDK